MSRNFNPILCTDAYKVGHAEQYPEGTQDVISNLTARGSRIPDIDHTVFFGLQSWIMQFLINDFNEGFFRKDQDSVIREYERRVTNLLGPDNNVGIQKIRDLHDLGYLPITIKALPEGTRVPLRVPMMTIGLTEPDERFSWVVNFLETSLSNAIWMPITSATKADMFRKMLDGHAMNTVGNDDGCSFQMHDFSCRGMSSMEAAAMSGAGHLLSSWGTDTLAAIEVLEDDYLGSECPIVGVSVAATEHSVVCAGGALNEFDTYDRLLDTYPTGIVSLVSDTWDLWKVVTEILPALKDKIEARDGKTVIRPDSGSPKLIICGDPDAPEGSPENLGLIRLLFETFGGTVSEKGYKLLSDKIGAIYGEAISRDLADDILTTLAEMGFASTNIVFGIGSFEYQYNTRDTFMMAVKATSVTINGVEQAIFKAPKTDKGGMKNSAKGRVCVVRDPDGNLILRDGVTKETEDAYSLLKPVFINGELVHENLNTLADMRARLGH
jgi:nicotinamide phosphoribosyltransferase